MTRLVLCSALGGLTILLALATSIVQSRNRDRGLALDSMKEECDMLEAANSEGCERILARDHGPLPFESAPAAGSGHDSSIRKDEPRGSQRLANGAVAP